MWPGPLLIINVVQVSAVDPHTADSAESGEGTSATDPSNGEPVADEGEGAAQKAEQTLEDLHAM